MHNFTPTDVGVLFLSKCAYLNTFFHFALTDDASALKITSYIIKKSF